MPCLADMPVISPIYTSVYLVRLALACCVGRILHVTVIPFFLVTLVGQWEGTDTDNIV